MRGKLTSQQTEKAIETIIMNAELQNRLIEDLLDVARIISG
jgi:signal transduction histidine kinase